MKDELKPILKNWEVGARIPVNFQSEVWHRIEHRAKVSSGFWEIFEWVFASIVIPRFAGVAAAVALIAGASIGQIQGNRDASMVWNSLETGYVDSINPLVHQAEKR